MSADPNQKSPRMFQCRDMLWDSFEQIARELECSIDYLINEAMKQYLKQRGIGAQSPSLSPFSDLRVPGPPPPPVRPPGPADRGLGSTVPPRPRVFGGGDATTEQAVQRSVAPPIPGSRAPRSSTSFAAVKAGPLAILCEGQRVLVSKDRFIIGRGKLVSDLTLKDPNVSRQHAMVERQREGDFLVDMGSTNGVEFNGQRVARKQISEGDTFRICDHELTFTYR